MEFFRWEKVGFAKAITPTAGKPCTMSIRITDQSLVLLPVPSAIRHMEVPLCIIEIMIEFW